MIQTIVTISSAGIVNKSKIKAFFDDLKPGSYILSAKPKNTRSLNQNSFYWAVMVPLVAQGLKDAGYDEIKFNEDAHEVIKTMFLKTKIGKEGQQLQLERVKSTTELTTLEFNNLIEEVQKWAAEFLNVVIPDPNQQTKLFNQ